jgi:CheY-like chemotaxis protein
MKTLTTRKIILVEDDPDDQELFATFCSNFPDIMLLPIAGNGLELIEYLQSNREETLPDLIILDQNMPLMNGKQTLQFLNSHRYFSQIPTVIYSTYTDSSLIVECKKLGAKMVAVKPIDEEGYVKMLKDFLTLLQ